MKGKRLKNQEEEEFVPKAFKKDKAIDKTEVSTKKTRKNVKSKKKANKKLKKIILIIILIAIIVIGITLAVSAIKWRNIAEDMLINENSVVVDANGNQIAKLGSERKQKKRRFNKGAQSSKKAKGTQGRNF